MFSSSDHPENDYQFIDIDGQNYRIYKSRDLLDQMLQQSQYDTQKTLNNQCQQGQDIVALELQHFDSYSFFQEPLDDQNHQNYIIPTNKQENYDDKSKGLQNSQFLSTQKTPSSLENYVVSTYETGSLKNMLPTFRKITLEFLKQSVQYIQDNDYRDLILREIERLKAFSANRQLFVEIFSIEQIRPILQDMFESNYLMTAIQLGRTNNGLKAVYISKISVFREVFEKRIKIFPRLQ